MDRSTFPLIELEGQPFEMGRQHGTLLGEQIICAWETMQTILTTDPFHSFPATWIRPSIEQVLDMIGRSIPLASRFAPELVEEMRGIAEGSGLAFEEIFALNSWADVFITLQVQANRDKGAGGCSGFAMGSAATVDGETYVGWNGDDSAWWLRSSVLLKGKPAGGLPFMLWTTAGSVGRPGLNPYLGLSANSLYPPDCSAGVPYALVCRKVLQQKSLADAVKVITDMPRMAGMNYTIGDTAGNVAAVETTARRVVELPGVEGRVVHTNHFVAEGLLSCEMRQGAAYYENTRARLGRLKEMLMEPGAKPATLEELQAVLSDHASNPYPICRHASDQPGSTMTLTSLICQPGQARMLVSYGPPCNGKVAEYTL